MIGSGTGYMIQGQSNRIHDRIRYMIQGQSTSIYDRVRYRIHDTGSK